MSARVYRQGEYRGANRAVCWWLAAAMGWLCPARALGQTPPPWEVPLRLAAPSDAPWRLQAMGLLAVALRVRTAVDAAEAVVPAAVTAGSLFQTPFVVWSGRDPVTLTANDRAALATWLGHGGLLVVDGDPVRDAGFLRSVDDILATVLPTVASPAPALQPLTPDDVVLRTFYLLRATGTVRVARAGTQVVVIESRGDLLGALATGSPPAREQATRVLVNAVMYGLCLDYKADQVHATFLMRRRSGP